MLHEEKTFRQTLNKGLRELKKMARQRGNHQNTSRGLPEVTTEDEGASPVTTGASDPSPEKSFCGCLSGRDLFKLQDTYGFPLELSVEECYREGIKLTENYREEFETALKEQRERSQTASKGMFKGGLEDHGEQTVKYHTATHLLLAALQKLVSPDIMQRGSNTTAERLRFDFNLDHKMTNEEKRLSRIK